MNSFPLPTPPVAVLKVVSDWWLSHTRQTYWVKFVTWTDIVGRIRRSAVPDAQIVVDGVAVVPHVPVIDNNNINTATTTSWLDSCWYVVSCHKLFGPHLGILCGPVVVRWNRRGDCEFRILCWTRWVWQSTW